MTTCPCCGGTVNAKLPLVDLNTNVISWNDQTKKVGGTAAELMSIFANRYPAIADYDFLIDRLWGAGEPPDASNTLKSHICHLRRAVKPLGLKIENVWGTGYRLAFAV